MDKIDLQNKTKAKQATIEAYWFENPHIDLERTLFHRITIPLEAFDSGHDYVEQPTETEIVLEWYDLKLAMPGMLDGMDLAHAQYPRAEGSVYIGSAHNWCDVLQLVFRQLADGSYVIGGRVNVEFETSYVAENEIFEFETTASFVKSSI